MDRMGDARMPGLVVHLAMQRDDGSIHYLDVWESKEFHDRAVAEVIHPAVHPVLAGLDGPPAGEPTKSLVNVIDVRMAGGPVEKAPA